MRLLHKKGIELELGLIRNLKLLICYNHLGKLYSRHYFYYVR